MSHDCTITRNLLLAQADLFRLAERRMNDLSETLRKPCLIERVEGALVIEPLRFFSLKSIAATRRHSVRRNYENSVRTTSHFSGDKA